MYNYVFVRKDIPIADQIVQVGHVCLEAGTRFGRSKEPSPYMVLLEVADVRHLQQTKEFLKDSGISFEIFFEPDNNMGETAICTEYLDSQAKKIFKKYKLWEQ